MSIRSSILVVASSTAVAALVGFLTARHVSASPASSASTAPGPAPAAAPAAPTTVVQIVAAAATPAAREPARPSPAPPPPSGVDPLAPPEGAPTPAQARAIVRERVTSSPPSSARWTRDATSAFESWVGTVGDRDAVRLDEVDCFEQGCIARATYRDSAAFDAMSASFVESAGFQAWAGTKWRSPPATNEAGGVEADWVLFAPDGE
jgi:hypothetical protein